MTTPSRPTRWDTFQEVPKTRLAPPTTTTTTTTTSTTTSTPTPTTTTTSTTTTANRILNDALHNISNCTRSKTTLPRSLPRSPPRRPVIDEDDPMSEEEYEPIQNNHAQGRLDAEDEGEDEEDPNQDETMVINKLNTDDNEYAFTRRKIKPKHPLEEDWGRGRRGGKTNGPYSCRDMGLGGHHGCTQTYENLGSLVRHTNEMAQAGRGSTFATKEALEAYHMVPCLAGERCKFIEKTLIGHYVQAGSRGGQIGHEDCLKPEETDPNVLAWSKARTTLCRKAAELLPHLKDPTTTTTTTTTTPRTMIQKWLFDCVTAQAKSEQPEGEVSDATVRLLAAGPNNCVPGRNSYQAADRLRDPSLSPPRPRASDPTETVADKVTRGWAVYMRTNRMDKATQQMTGFGLFVIRDDAGRDTALATNVPGEHPAEVRSTSRPKTPVPGEVSNATILKVLNDKESKGVASGYSGITFAHLEDAVNEPNSRWLQAMGLQVNYALQGGFNKTAAQDRLRAVSLTLLAKGETVAAGARPIAVGETFVNLVATVANKQYVGPAARAEAHLCDLGPRGLAEAAGPMVRAKLAALHEDGIRNALVLVVDATNAFGRVWRDGLLRVVAKYAPEALPLQSLFYAGSTPVFYRGKDGADEVYVQVVGSLQGEAAASNTYFLYTKEAADAVRKKHPESFQLSFVDDNYLVGPPKAVFKAYVDLKKEWAELNAQVSKTKLKALVSGPGLGEDDLARAAELGITLVQDGIKVMSTPVGTPEFVQAYTERTANKIADKLAILETMRDVAVLQDPFGVSKFSRFIPLSIPSSFVYTMRTAPPNVTKPLAAALDDATGRALMATWGVRIPEREEDWIRTKTRIFLSLDKGGMGVMGLAQTCNAAYLGAVALNLSHIANAVNPGADVTKLEEDAYPGAKQARRTLATHDWMVRLRDGTSKALDVDAFLAEEEGHWGAELDKAQKNGFTRVRDGLAKCSDEPVAAMQHEAAQAMQDFKQAMLTGYLAADEDDHPRGRADYMTQCCTGAALPLTAPAGDTHSRITNDNFGTFATLRLGLGLPGSEAHDTFQCPMCETQQPNAASHALSCTGMHRFRTRRHGEVKKALAEALRDMGKAKLHVVSDPEPFLADIFVPKAGVPDNEKMRGDVSVLIVEKGTTKILDLVVGAPRSETCVDGHELDPRIKPGNVAKLLERRKWANLERTHHVPQNKRHLFAPFAVETSGRIGDKSRETFGEFLDVAPATERDRRITGKDRVSEQGRARAEKRAYGYITAAIHRSNHVAVQYLSHCITVARSTSEAAKDPKSRGRKRLRE